MTEEAIIVTPQTVPTVDLSAEQSVNGGEWLLLTAVFAGSVYYLYGKYFRKKKAGGSSGGGCGGCAQKGGCPVSTVAHGAVKNAK